MGSWRVYILVSIGCGLSHRSMLAAGTCRSTIPSIRHTEAHLLKKQVCGWWSIDTILGIWPWPLAYDLDLRPWPLTYDLNLYKVKVNLHTEYQGSRSNGSATGECWRTDWRTQASKYIISLHAALSFAFDKNYTPALEQIHNIKSWSTAPALLSANAHWLQTDRQTITLDW